MGDLKDMVNGRQLYQAHPFSYFNQYKDIKTEEEFVNVLGEIVYRLHSLPVSIVSEDKFKEKDLLDITFFLTEKYWELSRKYIR